MVLCARARVINTAEMSLQSRRIRVCFAIQEVSLCETSSEDVESRKEVSVMFPNQPPLSLVKPDWVFHSSAGPYTLM